MARTTLAIRFDCAAWTAALDELARLAPELAERAPQLREGLVDLVQRLAKLTVFEADRDAAAGTGELFLRAQPPDGLREMVAAARAGQLDIAVVLGCGAIAGDPATLDGVDRGYYDDLVRLAAACAAAEAGFAAGEDGAAIDPSSHQEAAP